VGSIGGNPVGYYELEDIPSQGCEIAYFGVLPQWISQGLGGALLTHAIRRGFARGAARVWVHTCSLDHPTALAHYRARGFEVFKIEREDKELPERSPGPWPGA
jgi:ribosomal protein S18 acetylase RimI-like enzyme